MESASALFAVDTFSTGNKYGGAANYDTIDAGCWKLSVSATVIRHWCAIPTAGWNYGVTMAEMGHSIASPDFITGDSIALSDSIHKRFDRFAGLDHR